MAKTILPLVIKTTAPTVSDDASAGYFVGQEWQNTTTGFKYFCTSVAIGAAVWKLVAVNADAATFGALTCTTLTAGNVQIAPVSGYNCLSFNGAGNLSTATCIYSLASDQNLYLNAATGTSVRLRVGGTDVLAVSATAAVLGTDPGGGELLRIGGTSRFFGTLFVSKLGAAANITDANSALKIYDSSIGVGLFGMQTTGSPYAFQLQVADPTMAAYFPLHLQPRGGALILGADPAPGGSELLRVGGAIHASLTSVTNPVLVLRYNSSSVYGHHLMDGNGNYVIAAPSPNGVTGGRISIRASGVDIALFSSNSLVLGAPDPGGSDLLRVGGSCKLSGGITAGGMIKSTVATAANGLNITDNALSNFYVIPGYGSTSGTAIGTGGGEFLAFFTNGSVNKRGYITSTGEWILGTDPGGSALLRVGGSGRFSGSVLCGGGGYFSAQASGSAAPSLASRSAGTKVILYDTFSTGVSADAAIGVESSFVWYGVGGGGAGHKWYTNTTNTMLLSSAGALTTSGKLSANGAAASSTLTGNTVAQVISWLQTVFA